MNRKRSCRPPRGRRTSLKLDDAMLRADRVATLLGFVGRDRRRFLHTIAPEFQAWLDHDGPGLPPDCPSFLQLSTLAARVEKTILRRRLTLGDLSLILDTLAHESYVASPDGAATSEVPGSEAKVQVMIDRAQRGESLFQRGDVGLPDYLAFVSIVRGRETERLELIDVKTAAKAGQDGDGGGEGSAASPALNLG